MAPQNSTHRAVKNLTLRKAAFPVLLSGFPAGLAGAIVGHILDAAGLKYLAIKYLLICGSGAIAAMISFRYLIRKFEIMQMRERAEPDRNHRVH